MRTNVVVLTIFLGWSVVGASAQETGKSDRQEKILQQRMLLWQMDADLKDFRPTLEDSSEDWPVEKWRSYLVEDLPLDYATTDDTWGLILATSPLILAMNHRSMNLARLLVENGVPVNGDEHHVFPLVYWMKDRGGRESPVIAYLVEHGAVFPQAEADSIYSSYLTTRDPIGTRQESMREALERWDSIFARSPEVTATFDLAAARAPLVASIEEREHPTEAARSSALAGQWAPAIVFYSYPVVAFLTRDVLSRDNPQANGFGGLQSIAVCAAGGGALGFLGGAIVGLGGKSGSEGWVAALIGVPVGAIIGAAYGLSEPVRNAVNSNPALYYAVPIASLVYAIKLTEENLGR